VQALLWNEPNSAPPLVGIARLAAWGESMAEGHNVEYFTLPVRSLLNRCTSPRMPFTWTINPYRGCEFACKYCYARYTHEFMEMREGADFERKIYVKQEAAGLLRRDLRRVKRGESIAIGTATDPYQPAERRYQVTRGIMEELAAHRGLEIGVVSKSTLLLRDLELFREISRHNSFAITVTITTVSSALARLLEPRAPRPDLRLAAVRQLVEAGINAGVICAPVLPGITDAPSDLETLVKAAARAGARHLHANPLFLKPCSEKVFMPFLEERFPHLVEDYRRRFQQGAFLSSAYRRRISQLFSRLRRQHGIAEGEWRARSVAAEDASDGECQLALF